MPKIPRFELPPDQIENSPNRVAEALARCKGENRYEAVNEILSPQEDGTNPLTDWTAREITEFLHTTLGPPEELTISLGEMSEEEIVARFPSDAVRSIVARYVAFGVSPEGKEGK